MPRLRTLYPEMLKPRLFFPTMKPCWLLLLLLLTVNTAFTQSFLPVSGPVLEQQLAFNQANECYLFFDNLSGDTLQLRWRNLSPNFPEDWVVDLCDYGLCYAGIPPNGTMAPVYDTIQPYLKLIVQPGAVAGSGWLWFRVFEKDHEDNYVDVFFSLFTQGTTGIIEPGAADLEVYPNPASDLLFIDNKSDRNREFRLLDAAGHEWSNQSILPGGHSIIEVGLFPVGTYFLQSYRAPTQKIILQR